MGTDRLRVYGNAKRIKKREDKKESGVRYICNAILLKSPKDFLKSVFELTKMPVKGSQCTNKQELQIQVICKVKKYIL